ncbi:MAG: arylesterase [Acidobacteriaceae bacterium]|nr:arylesterase [Acidobacteriaceae bacterium]
MQTRRRFLAFFLFFVLGSPLFAAGRPLLVCFGDSITAGFGLESSQAYPAALQRDLDRLGYPYQVVNRGTSGATTKDAVVALPSILKLHPAVVIVEFGGNDGLRGQPLDQMRGNLDSVIAALQHAHIKILVAGITLPPNYGSDYIHTFEKIYVELAAEHHTALVPMIYKDLVNVPGVIQPDGIHPTAKGSEIIANTLIPILKPLLDKNSGAR